MTYITGGNVQAADYNTFATLAASINEVFADLHSGATTIGAGADYGYGQTPALTSVVAGNSILATEWAALYDAMRDCGTHQGTAVSPPVPGSNPIAGGDITAYNTPSTFAAVVALLRTNRHNLAGGQTLLTVGSNFVQPGGANPWTNTLTWNYRVDFSSWNNARYFFNSGGSLNLNGSYSPNSTPEDAQWISMFATMSPLVFNWNSTSPFSGTGGTAIGFYNLTTSYQTIYFKTYGSGYYYVNSSITVQAKLNAAAGTNGLVDFRIILTDADPTPDVKTSTTTYRVDNVKSAGVIVYPGPAVTVSSVGANSGFVAT
jgi:hypothetical protein